ncbi:MAG: signal peptidase I [Polyangiaceae bacterium]|nr:signal peptidase I [Polyangiaceae bacterium]
MLFRLFGWLPGLLWFVLLPLGLAVGAVSVLSLDPSTLPEGPFVGLRLWISDQKVPALIFFFALFDLLLYRFRYYFPWADRLGLVERPGLSKESRSIYDLGNQLSDDTRRTLRRHLTAIRSELGQKRVEEIEVALQKLDALLGASEFQKEEVEKAIEELDGITTRHLAPWSKGETREYIESIVIAVGVALLLRAFVVQAFKIPSGSMLPTLQIQDHLFVNKFAYGPKVPFTDIRLMSDLPPDRGDIVVFVYPDSNPNHPKQDYIKRVIAQPGDTLRVEGGFPIINGFQVPHCRVGDYSFINQSGYKTNSELFIEYLDDEAYLVQFVGGRRLEVREGPYQVKEGEFWVLGDNRNNSRDSRAWRHNRGAGVPFVNVKGRALFVWLSFSNQSDSLLGVTWDRLFTNVMGKPRLPKEAPSHLKEKIDECLTHRPSETSPPPASALVRN